MKQKLRKIIALFLVTVLLVPPFYATAEEGPSDNEKKQIVQNMMQHIASQSYDTIIREGICYYPEMIENILSDTPATSTIELVSYMADMGSLIDISEEKYCEVLVNIMAISEYNNASDIAAQKEQDNLKTLQDYGMDVAEMSANAANIMTGTASLGTLGEGINLAISSLEVLASNTDNWIQALSNLETITQNYASFELFLDSVQNSAVTSLRSAAKKLQQGMETAMKLKLETYADVSNENFENYQAFFFQDVFFTAVKNSSEYSADQTLAYFVDLGDAAVNAFSVLTSSWELGKQIGTLIGNLTVGGENLLNRLQEILVAVYIRRALITTMMDNITRFATNYSNENTEDLYEISEEYVALARYLVNCDIRGMYCMYSIVVTDAQLLSWLNMGTAQEAEEWYENKTDFEVDAFTSLFASILEPNLEIPPEAVEFNGHYYTIYDFSPLSSSETNTWENAFDYCEGVNGNMAVINSEEENDFLMSLLVDSPYDQAYFGLRNDGENNWEWANGSTDTYRNWSFGTDDHRQGSYAMLSTDNSDGTWDQGDFTEADGGTAFFCEWEGAFDFPINENAVSTDPITVFNQALVKLDGTDLSIIKEGSFSADFVNFSELQFTQKMDIQQFGQPTMTASGHYTSTGGSGGSTSEMDYNFTYDSQGMHIPDYEQPVTGELVTLELPPLECVHSYSETGRDGGGKTYLVTYDGETLTQENCGIFSSVLDSSFRIYWSPSEEYADEDGIQQAEVLFSIDNDGNLVSIEVSYQMYAGIQGIAPVEGTTTFTFGSVNANNENIEQQIPEGAGEFAGHSYYAFNMDSIDTWEDADAYCKSLGGYLATITSAEEDAFVYRYLTENYEYESAYFGFSDHEQEGVWKWVTGEPVSYTNWGGTREPNGENPNEDYAMYYYKYDDGGWNDGDFGGRTVNSGRVFICEWDVSPTETVSENVMARWNEFIASGEYTEFTSQMTDYEGNQLESSYSLVDIDGDGWEEMILYAPMNDGIGFGRHAVLSCDKDTGEISFIPIKGRMQYDNEGYANVVQNCRGVHYFPKFHAISYTELNNGMMYQNYGFWTIQNGKLEESFSLVSEYNVADNDTIFYLLQDGEQENITQEEYEAFLDENEKITFQSFPSAQKQS